MTQGRSRRKAVVPGRVLVRALLPFLLPAWLTLLVAQMADWPRDIAPGSGLKLAGLLAAAATAVAAWGWSARGIGDLQVRRMSAVLCGLVGLLSWPLWSVGVLPSVNGAVLGAPTTVQMRLELTETTPVRRSQEFHHWVWLAPEEAAETASGLERGRYYIPEATYNRLTAEKPARVEVEAARGMLGAVVVMTIR